MDMNTRTYPSALDLTLRARHLRSAHLADLFRKILPRVRGIAGQAKAAPRQTDLALERH